VESPLIPQGKKHDHAVSNARQEQKNEENTARTLKEGNQSSSEEEKKQRSRKIGIVSITAISPGFWRGGGIATGRWVSMSLNSSEQLRDRPTLCGFPCGALTKLSIAC